MPKSKAPKPAQPVGKPLDADGRTNPQAYASTSLAAPAGLAEQRLGPPDVQEVSQSLSLINPAAVYLYRQARFQPIAYLTPESLTSQLSEWNVGTYRRYSLTMDAIENRDAIVKTATGKLKMSISRRDYEIVKVEGADPVEAEAHANALEYFYSHLQCTNAVDRNQIGGFHTLVHQMMDAALKRYAVHEIVWKPTGPDELSAMFIFVPLWFFEGRTGSLRFAGNFAWDGIMLQDGQWMVTVGEGIMEAISVAYMYKTIALRDWLVYSQRNGMPLPIGKTNHPNGSAGWNSLQEALRNLGPDNACIVGLQDDIDKLEFNSTGQLPYPLLTELMDKYIAALARGSDLSTLSSSGHNSNQATGSSVQNDQEDIIEVHYAQVIGETLNHFIDKKVLAWHFGEDVEPLAYIKINIPQRKDVVTEIAIDQFLLSCGVRLGVDNALERYGRVEAEDDEEPLSNPAEQMGGLAGAMGTGDMGSGQPDSGSNLPDQPAFGGRNGAPQRVAANAFHASKTFLSRARHRFAKDTSIAVKPLMERIKSIQEIANDQDFVAALKHLRADLPTLLKGINNNPENGKALQAIMGAMLLQGLTDGPKVKTNGHAVNEFPDIEPSDDPVARQIFLANAKEEEGTWITINGAHVLIGKDGIVKKGPERMVGHTQAPAGEFYHGTSIENAEIIAQKGIKATDKSFGFKASFVGGKDISFAYGFGRAQESKNPKEVALVVVKNPGGGSGFFSHPFNKTAAYKAGTIGTEHIDRIEVYHADAKKGDAPIRTIKVGKGHSLAA